MKRKLFFILYFFILFIIFYSCLTTFSHAAYPKLISKLSNAFESIVSCLLKLATPAAAVAVGTGIFMKKFSFGDEEKIRMGKNIIRGSLFSYAFILLLDLILSAIEGLVG